MAKRYSEDDLKRIDKAFLELIEDRDWVVLVADSSTAFRKMLVNALNKAGFERVVDAKDGMDAMMHMKDLEDNAIAAVVELTLPIMNGLQFLQEFKKKANFKNSHVILVSTDSRKEVIVGVIKAGATAYLKKPFPAETLIEKLKSLGVE